MPSDAIDSIKLLGRLRMGTQKTLAEDAGVSAQRMSRMLNRQSELPESAIRSLAAATGYPEEFFKLGYRELAPIQLTYRHTSRTPVRRLHAISAEYSVLSEFSYGIWERLGASWKTGWIDRLAVKDEDIAPEKIDDLADECRKAMGLPPNGHIGNVINAAERSGIIVAPLENFAADDPEAHLTSDGVTCAFLSDGCAPAIGYSKAMPGDRLRFTIAHEIGHLVLHRYRRPERYNTMEAEAHRFASAFLMPSADARKIINERTFLSDFLRIKAQWGMSIAALITRGYNAGSYGKDRWRSLFMQLSARKWRYDEPVRVGREQPVLLRSMLSRLYGKGGVVDPKAIETDTGIPISTVGQWAPGLRYARGFSARDMELLSPTE